MKNDETMQSYYRRVRLSIEVRFFCSVSNFFHFRTLR